MHENQPWSIKCSNLKSDDLIRWTRNGQSLEPELASGQLVVQSPVGSGSSTLQAMHATDNHEGDYKCTQDSDESFHLWIYYGSYIDFPWQISLLLCSLLIYSTTGYRYKRSDVCQLQRPLLFPPNSWNWGHRALSC